MRSWKRVIICFAALPVAATVVLAGAGKGFGLGVTVGGMTLEKVP